MSFKKALIIYRKEMLEMFRDKRTIFSTIILPFILYPILFIGLSSIMMRQTAKLEQQGAVVALVDSVNDSATKLIVRQLKNIEHFDYITYDSTVDSLYRDKSVHSIVIITDSVQTSGIPIYLIKVKMDKSTDRGKLIAGKFGEALRKSEKGILEQRLKEFGISTEVISTINYIQQDTSSAQKKLGSLLGAILPYLLIMLLVAGASVVAGDLVAGEKERKTLETLLVSSAHRNEIVLGKYLTIITFALINVAVNLFSLYFSMRNIASQSGLQMAGVSFPTQGFLILFIALIPLATLYAAVLLSISSFSRNMKEARSYEQPIILVSMLLAMSSFFPAIELTNGLALIPIINISLLFKAVMMSDYQLSHLLLTIGSTLLLDIFAIIFTVKLFNNESVLFRSDVGTSIKQISKNKKVLFSPYYGILYFVISLLALYYLGSHWQMKNIVSGLIQTQLLIITLPVLLLLKLVKSNWKDTLRFNNTKAVNYILLIFISLPATILVALIGQLINILYPIPADYLQRMIELLKMPDLKIWQVFGVIAVMPGICEEIMFRGFLFRFFEKQGKWIAIIISAILFSVFHLDPYRLIPVFFLGVLLAWIMYKSNSIYLSILAHMLNNGLALVFVHFPNMKLFNFSIVKQESLNWWIGIPAVIVLTLSLYIFKRVNTNEKEIG